MRLSFAISPALRILPGLAITALSSSIIYGNDSRNTSISLDSPSNSTYHAGEEVEIDLNVQCKRTPAFIEKQRKVKVEFLDMEGNMIDTFEVPKKEFSSKEKVMRALPNIPGKYAAVVTMDAPWRIGMRIIVYSPIFTVQ